MGRIKKRVVQLTLFWIISEVAIWLIMDLGHHRYGSWFKSEVIPISVLFSWGGVFFKGLAMRVCFIIYLACLLFLNSLTIRAYRSSIPILPICVHAIGSIAAYFRLRVSNAYISNDLMDVNIVPNQLFWVLCLIVCLPIALFFLWNDWWQAEPNNPNFTLVVKDIVMKRLRPMIAAIIIGLFSLGGYELIRIGIRKKAMMSIRDGTKKSEVLKLLGNPRLIVKDKESILAGPQKRPELMNRQITKMSFDLGLFDSSGIEMIIDDQNDEVLLVWKYKYYRALPPFQL